MILQGIKKLLTGDVIKPVTDLVDNLVTSDEERIKAQAQLQHALNAVELAVQERMTAQMNQVFDLSKVEASQGNFLQRSWRPLTMLMLVSLIPLDAVGLVQLNEPGPVYDIIQMGLGLYVGGRTAEKIVPGILEKVIKR